MRSILSFLITFLLWMPSANAGVQDLPKLVDVAEGTGHVQGIAVDTARKCIYFSFTTRFVKTDWSGNVLGSIDRIQGHLGAMTLNPEDGKVYASLECKDDEIGRGIADRLDINLVDKSRFYVAIIDPDRVTEIGMDPENDPVLRTVCVKDAVRDYADSVTLADGSEVKHRFGCSGIDGITFAPAPGRKGGRMLLYVAYGVYGDITRSDNDCQVILCYDPAQMEKYARTVSFGTLHESGPEKPLRKYFAFTGNTTYGVQNLCYDPFTGYTFMAVYRGKKEQYPNYSLYALDMRSRSFKGKPAGISYSPGRKHQLRLASDGLEDDSTGIRGWNFKWGSTGFFAVGDGLYYISENYRIPETKVEGCKARLYKWTGDPMTPFVPAQ